MPFLSLGLQNEEQQKDEQDRSTLSDNNSPKTRSQDVAATDSPLHQAEYKISPVGPDATAVSVEPESKLPPAIEELRRKIAGNDNDNNLAPLPAANVDGIPTFTTFQFGYLPGRGLLY